MSQHKATRRQSLRSALAHRRAADVFLDALKETQEAFNATMVKLGADTPGALDTDYEATLAISPLFEADEVKLPGQHKSTMRAAMRSALAHKRLADELVDALEEFQAAHTALLVKLDAEGGTLSSTDFESTLAVTATDADGVGSGAQHKAPLRKSLEKALSHKRLAGEIMDAIVGLQGGFRSSLQELDSGSTSNHTDYQVDVLDPDA